MRGARGLQSGDHSDVRDRTVLQATWRLYLHSPYSDDILQYGSGKIQILSVVPPTKSAHAISSIFSPKIQLGPNWQQSTTKMDVAWLRCDADSSEEFHISDTIIQGQLKKQTCSVVPPTKPAQAISSIFSPNIQLWPNWQQSTTKMAVSRLRCDADSSEVFHIIDTIF